MIVDFEVFETKELALMTLHNTFNDTFAIYTAKVVVYIKFEC